MKIIILIIVLLGAPWIYAEVDATFSEKTTHELTVEQTTTLEAAKTLDQLITDNKQTEALIDASLTHSA